MTPWLLLGNPSCIYQLASLALQFRHTCWQHILLQKHTKKNKKIKGMSFNTSLCSEADTINCEIINLNQAASPKRLSSLQ